MKATLRHSSGPPRPPRRGAPQRWLVAAALAAVVAWGCAASAAAQPVLIPQPASRAVLPGEAFRPAEGRHVWADPRWREELRLPAEIVQEALALLGEDAALTAWLGDGGEAIAATVTIDPVAAPRAQGYVLEVRAGRIALAGHDAAGALHGAVTLRQLARQATGALEAQRIDDWPAFPTRGFLLDISRDKVPTRETLARLVDLLAELKLNHLQLYMEHTFAYRGHEAVWGAASPLTGEDILWLDALCAARGIDLVPCQNSFGHMERWLRHEAYAALGEAPANATSLSPAAPGSLKLVLSLHAELMAHFRSRYLNVCCDEVQALGTGRSRALVEERGFGEVYLAHLLALAANARAQGRTTMFWGDMIAPFDEALREERRALAARLPPGMVALVWGYRPDDPLAAQAEVFARAGVPFLVCTGTSSWTSFTGRHGRMLGNVQAAVDAAVEHGAGGILMCDWGERGWRPLPVMLPGLAHGADLAWRPRASNGEGLARALDLHVLHDKAGVLGAVLVEMGGIHALQGATDQNIPPSMMFLLDPGDTLRSPIPAMASPEGLRASIAAADDLAARLRAAPPRTPDAALVAEELDVALGWFRLSCALLLARLESGAGSASDLPAADAAALGAQIDALAARFAALWTRRNREGGLADSLAHFAHGRALLREAEARDPSPQASQGAPR